MQAGFDPLRPGDLSQFVEARRGTDEAADQPLPGTCKIACVVADRVRERQTGRRKEPGVVDDVLEQGADGCKHDHHLATYMIGR